jgi:hypothetical protein
MLLHILNLSLSASVLMKAQRAPLQVKVQHAERKAALLAERRTFGEVLARQPVLLQRAEAELVTPHNAAGQVVGVGKRSPAADSPSPPPPGRTAVELAFDGVAQASLPALWGPLRTNPCYLQPLRWPIWGGVHDACFCAGWAGEPARGAGAGKGGGGAGASRWAPLPYDLPRRAHTD